MIEQTEYQGFVERCAGRAVNPALKRARTDLPTTGPTVDPTSVRTKTSESPQERK